MQRFHKMHGLGNDFVILDGRQTPLNLSADTVRAVADRRRGIGCDGVITLSTTDNATVHMRIQNADGSDAEACGNVTRCVAQMMMNEKGGDSCTIETVAGLLTCNRTPDGIQAFLGKPALEWQNIPLAEPRDTLHMGLEFGALKDPVGVNMGNPHAVFFVKDIKAIDIASLGPVIETYPLFPERVNVGVVQVLSRSEIRFRVWERGAGITQACGTGAAAAVVAGVRRGLLERRTLVLLDGGPLLVEWHEDSDQVSITGPAAHSFTGEIALDTFTTGPQQVGASA